MRLAETHYDNSETGCCAPLDADHWDGKEITWEAKPFLRDHIREFVHVPLNYGSVITRDNEAIEKAAAYPEDPLWLTDEVSPWGSDIYLAVDGEVPGAKIDHLSGTFMTKVFEGPYRHIGKWTKAMDQHVHDAGHEVDKMYFYYATCPKCAKHFGKNQVVLFAKVH